MRDQSHKDEMSSLLKADFARLRARGIATKLAQPASETSTPEPLAEPSIEPPERTQESAPADGWLKRLLRTP
jgi:hypothetical protein